MFSLRAREDRVTLAKKPEARHGLPSSVKSLIKYVAIRILGLVPQILGSTIVIFLLLKFLPNPVYQLLGPFASHKNYEAVSQHLGLTRPLYEQYFLYLDNLVHGNLGTSWFDAAPVSHEIAVRLGPTLELVALSLIVIIFVGITAGTVIAVSRKLWVLRRGLDIYALLAGAFPDFWLALVLAFIFSYKLHWLPAPLGQLSPGQSAPPRITGAVAVDALVTGNMTAFGSAIGHLILPVATLVLVYMAPIVKITQATVTEMAESEFCRHARASGLPQSVIVRYALRNSLPAIATLTAVTFSYLFGGDVLVENVFSWGGIGSWAVQSAAQSDFFAIEGFVLTAVILNMLLYLILDIFYVLIDPRLAVEGK